MRKLLSWLFEDKNEKRLIYVVLNQDRDEPKGAQIDRVLDRIQKAGTILALIIGGVWAAWTFILTRQAEWGLEMHVEPSIFPGQTNTLILLARVSLKNVGKVVIRPGAEGCTVSIRRMKAQSEPESLIDIDRDFLPAGLTNNLLSKYEKGSYELEPGVTYNEEGIFLVQSNQFYLLEARFWNSDNFDAVTERRLVSTASFEKKKEPH